MAGFVGEDQVRRVKDATDLVALIGDYTPVRRAGRNHVCCCPFHQERSPSCHVYDDGHYHCYGCGAHGDVLTLVREKERLEFTEAVEYLARRAGIEIEYQKGKGEGLARSDRDRFVEAYEVATRFYEQVLWDTVQGAEARAYLAGRGLSVEVCKRFRLGWAPGSGQLVEELRKRRIEPAVAAQLDLAVDRNGRWQDRFYERVTFPICDRFGNPIAFSARLLPEAERRMKEEGRGVGKYINSTDTPLYRKGNVVFNLHHARITARDKGRLLVMEGPTDVMAAADAGITECVAVLGTAFTPEHAKQLGNLPGEGGRLILILDGDRAGQTNALKAVRTCLSSGVPCWVATLPDELDPSELIKEDSAGGGRMRFEQVVQQARADVEHLLRAIAPRPHELDHRALLAAADEVLEVLRGISDPELRGLYLRDLGAWLGIDRARLDKRLAGAGGPATQAQAHHGGADLPAVDDAVVHILVCRPELRDEAFDRLGLEPSHLVETVRPLVERLAVEPSIDGDGLLLACEAPDLAPLKPLLFHWLTTNLIDRVPAIADDNALVVLVASIERLRRTRTEDDLRRVTNAITEAEHRRDFAEAGRLGREKLALSRALADLRHG